MLIPIFLSAFVLFTLLVPMPRWASAHCDTEDGPAVNDGRKALQTGVANHALMWILPEADAELRPIFDEAMKARALGPDAADLAAGRVAAARRPLLSARRQPGRFERRPLLEADLHAAGGDSRACMVSGAKQDLTPLFSTSVLELELI